MSLTRLGLLTAVAALAVALPASAALPKLVGTVGPGFTITLTKGGTKVRSLKPGKYTLVVRDRSEDHNFHLTGPGVNKATGVEAVGTRTFTVTLKRGTYRFLCDPHPDSMKGSFRVG